MARPGQMDQRITLRGETLTGDGQGGQTRKVADKFSAWAEVVPGTGAEQDRHDRLVGEAMYTFTFRNRPDVTVQESDRVLWDGIEYNVRFVARPGGRDLYISVTAERGVAQ